MITKMTTTIQQQTVKNHPKAPPQKKQNGGLGINPRTVAKTNADRELIPKNRFRRVLDRKKGKTRIKSGLGIDTVSLIWWTGSSPNRKNKHLHTHKLQAGRVREGGREKCQRLAALTATTTQPTKFGWELMLEVWSGCLYQTVSVPGVHRCGRASRGHRILLLALSRSPAASPRRHPHQCWRHVILRDICQSCQQLCGQIDRLDQIRFD